MTILRIALGSLALLALTGCTASYKLASGVPVAELTFITTEADATAYICDLDKHQFTKLGMSARSTSAGGQFLAGLTYGLSERNKSIVPLVKNIQADARIRIIGESGAMKSIGPVTQMSTCNVAVDVIPKPGGRYKAEYSYDWKPGQWNDAGQCQMSLLEFDTAAQTWNPVPSLPDSPSCLKEN